MPIKDISVLIVIFNLAQIEPYRLCDGVLRMRNIL